MISRILVLMISALMIAMFSAGTTEQVTCYFPTNQEITDLFDLWNDALATENSQTVANRYTDNAVLLATVSDQPRNTPALIKEYFDKFLLNKPQGVILINDPEPGCNQATDMGLYVFTFGKDGSKVKARYTFTYVLNTETQEWKISHHHSSMLPEQFLDEGEDLSGYSLKLSLAAFLLFLLF